MTSSDLQNIFDLLGVSKIEGSWVAKCPFCQDEDSQSNKLNITKGHTKLVLAFCFGCCEAGDRQGIFDYWKRVCAYSGVTEVQFFELTQSRSQEYIDTIWNPLDGTIPTTTVSNIDEVAEVYEELLTYLELSEDNGRWLEDKGMDAEYAYSIGYRTTPDAANADIIADSIWSVFGDVIYSVPGLIRSSGRAKILFRDNSILMPARDYKGRINSFKHRILDGKKRMRWLSSNLCGGPKAIACCHVPLGVGNKKWDQIILTEGERKADVIYHRTKCGVVGIPGVGSWKLAIPVLKQILEDKGLVILGLDVDEAGEKCTKTLGKYLREFYTVEVARWDTQKGYDDCLISNTPISTIKFGDYLRSDAANTQQKSPESSIEIKQPLIGQFWQEGQSISDIKIVDYLKANGPTLKIKVPCYIKSLNNLISKGLVKSKYTNSGPVVYVE